VITIYLEQLGSCCFSCGENIGFKHGEIYMFFHFSILPFDNDHFFIFPICPFHNDPAFLNSKVQAFYANFLYFHAINYKTCYASFISSFETKKSMCLIFFNTMLCFNTCSVGFCSYHLMFQRSFCKFLFVSSYVLKLVFFISVEVSSPNNQSV
jgi:hypothetical protein